MHRTRRKLLLMLSGMMLVVCVGYGITGLILRGGLPKSARGWLFAFTAVPVALLAIEAATEFVALPVLRFLGQRSNAALAQAEHRLRGIDQHLEQRWHLRRGTLGAWRIYALLALPLVVLLGCSFWLWVLQPR